MQAQIVQWTAAPAPTKVRWNVRDLRHPDVLLPLVAALIVLLLLLAWAT